MTEIDLALALGASITTGGVSTLATIKALGVHITYIKERLIEHGAAIQRAHDRVDSVEDELARCRMVMARLHPGEKV